MDIKQLQKDSYRIAVDHGFYEGYDFDRTDPRANATRLMLIVSELAEALEDIRNDVWDTELYDIVEDNGFDYRQSDYHPHGLPIELADAVIRIADYAEWLGIDLTEAISVKQDYNSRRPYKHGGKAI